MLLAKGSQAQLRRLSLDVGDMISRPLAEAVWKFTRAVMVLVVVLAAIVFLIIGFSDSADKPSMWLLISLFLGFLIFSYLLYRIMKFIKETIIEGRIRD